MSISNQNPQLQTIPQTNDLEETNQEEFTNFLSSLPIENGFRTRFLYKYQGFWHEPLYLKAIIACQNHFQAQDGDILLVTPPKCGTTWMKALIFTIVNRDEHPPFSKKHPLVFNNSHELVPFLEMNLYRENKLPDLSSFKTPRLLSTHVPFALLPQSVQNSKCKIVYLWRNAKDVFTSFWHFMNKMKVDDDARMPSLEVGFDKFCEGVSLYAPFWDHVLDYWKKHMENPDHVFFLSYEQLKDNPNFCLRRLAKFLGYPFSKDEESLGLVEEIFKMCSFEHLTSLEVNMSGKQNNGRENKVFFRKGEVGDWKNLLTNEMAEKLDVITKEKFKGTGLKWDSLSV